MIFVNLDGIERELGKGFFRFVFIKGGVNVGLAAASLALFCISFFSELSSQYIMTFVPTFFVGGILWGGIMWLLYSKVARKSSTTVGS